MTKVSQSSKYKLKNENINLYLITQLNTNFDTNTFKKQHKAQISTILQCPQNKIGVLGFNGFMDIAEVSETLANQNIKNSKIIPLAPFQGDLDKISKNIYFYNLNYQEKDDFSKFLQDLIQAIQNDTSQPEILKNLDFLLAKNINKFTIIILHRIFTCPQFQFAGHPLKFSMFLNDRIPVVHITHIDKMIDEKVIEQMLRTYYREKPFLAKYSDRRSVQNSLFYSMRFTYSDIDTCTKIIEQFNFTRIDDQEIYVHFFIPHLRHLQSMKKWKLHVRNLPSVFTTRQLYYAFSNLKIGNSKLGEIYMAKYNQKSCSGSIQYYSEEVANLVEQKCAGAMIHGQQIEVFKKSTIAIYNFCENISEYEIHDFFSEYNPISIEIVNRNEMRPVVFISFKSEENAVDAMDLIERNNSNGMRLLPQKVVSKKKLKANQFADFENKKLDYNSSIVLTFPFHYTQLELIELCSRYGNLTFAGVESNETETLGKVEFNLAENKIEALQQLSGLIINDQEVKVQEYTVETQSLNSST